MSDTWMVWYASAIRALRDIRGDSGVVGYDGAAMPAMYAQDTVSILMVVGPRLSQAIAAWMRQNNGSAEYAARAIHSANVDSNGVVYPIGWNETVNSKSIDEYLAGAPSPTKGPAHRIVPKDMVDFEYAYGSYTLWTTTGFTAESKSRQVVLIEYRRAVGYWQSTVNMSAAAINGSGVGVAAPAAAIKEYLVQLRQLCRQLDAIASNPPPTNWDYVRETIREGANRAADIVGETVAVAADKAGELAGRILQGFLGNASVMTIVVASIAIFAYAR